MPDLFDSRNLAYRSPFGAVAEGSPLFFRLCLPRELGVSGGVTRLCRDDGSVLYSDLFWAGMEGGRHEWWDCHFTPPDAQLYWYDFVLSTAEGTRFLTRLPDGKAALSAAQGARWQLTVYRRDFVTPDWLSGGVIYQIFPDRFAASGEPKQDVPADRKLHAQWGGLPDWAPDADGEIRNRDYFGGDLAGIRQKLPYLRSLGVTCLYLNPIFEAHSNHRYDTADYERVDPLLGTEADLRDLCLEAERHGIRVMLDGVFSHTGADSRYFNREGRYPPVGAANTPDSPYAGWYTFTRWPDEYKSWWGFATLPEVNECDPSYLAFITGERGVVRRWIAAGAAGGFRLDVADELPDPFLTALYAAVKAERPDAMVLGEVWEDASNKCAYGRRRQYLLGGQMDSVMNYPFCRAVLEVVRGGEASAFFNTVMDITEHYPPQVIRLLMNPIGTHDTVRALTALAGEPIGEHDRAWQAAYRLSPDQRRRGLRLMRLAAALQYCLPGVPSLYYGDEAGMEGCRDPFNRGCFPWGAEDAGLTDWYRQLGGLRERCPALREGRFIPIEGRRGCLSFAREDAGSGLLCAVNATEEETALWLPPPWQGERQALGDGTRREDGRLILPPLSCAILWTEWGSTNEEKEND